LEPPISMWRHIEPAKSNKSVCQEVLLWLLLPPQAASILRVASLLILFGRHPNSWLTVDVLWLGPGMVFGGLWWSLADSRAPDPSAGHET